jgi:hypothetical protein
MVIKIDQELLTICKEIINENWDEGTWAGHEADDWFQTENYEGGFDADESAFCFGKKNNKKELWFQFTLVEASKILQKTLTELKVTN